MYVADAHAFLWFLLDDPKLGKKALKIFRACDLGKEIVVIPSIVLLECMYVCEKKRVNFDFGDVLHKLEGTFNYPIYPLDEEVILQCTGIRQVIEMHDRIIVATARLLNAKLITKDDNIVNSKVVQTVW
jgi:PIN domain nuclease of toxin-antitoxin system